MGFYLVKKDSTQVYISDFYLKQKLIDCSGMPVDPVAFNIDVNDDRDQYNKFYSTIQERLLVKPPVLTESELLDSILKQDGFKNNKDLFFSLSLFESAHIIAIAYMFNLKQMSISELEELIKIPDNYTRSQFLLRKLNNLDRPIDIFERLRQSLISISTTDNSITKEKFNTSITRETEIFLNNLPKILSYTDGTSTDPSSDYIKEITNMYVDVPEEDRISANTIGNYVVSKLESDGGFLKTHSTLGAAYKGTSIANWVISGLSILGNSADIVSIISLIIEGINNYNPNKDAVVENILDEAFASKYGNFKNGVRTICYNAFINNIKKDVSRNGKSRILQMLSYIIQEKAKASLKKEEIDVNEKFKDSLKVVLAQYSCEIAPYLYEDIKKEIENTFEVARNNEINKLVVKLLEKIGRSVLLSVITAGASTVISAFGITTDLITFITKMVIYQVTSTEIPKEIKRYLDDFSKVNSVVNVFLPNIIKYVQSENNSFLDEKSFTDAILFANLKGDNFSSLNGVLNSFYNDYIYGKKTPYFNKILKNPTMIDKLPNNISYFNNYFSLGFDFKNLNFENSGQYEIENIINGSQLINEINDIINNYILIDDEQVMLSNFENIRDAVELIRRLKGKLRKIMNEETKSDRKETVLAVDILNRYLDFIIIGNYQSYADNIGYFIDNENSYLSASSVTSNLSNYISNEESGIFDLNPCFVFSLSSSVFLKYYMTFRDSVMNMLTIKNDILRDSLLAEACFKSIL